MMEENSGNALAETFDDEDPDTNDWDDMYDEESDIPAVMVDDEASSSDSVPVHDESDSSSEVPFKDNDRETKKKNAKVRDSVFVDAEEFEEQLKSGDRLASHKRKVGVSQGQKKKKQKK